MLADLAYVAEVIGAIAIVVSLFYVASQIRQNTRAVKSATAQSVHEHFPSRYQLLANDSELSQIVFGERFRDYVEKDLMQREPHPEARPMRAFSIGRTHGAGAA